MLLTEPKISGVGYTFDVTKYGAKGDGITDDTAAIQAAASAAYLYANSATKQAIVFFPQGIYSMNNTQKYIAWDGSNVGQITFLGAGATIKFDGNYCSFVNCTFSDPAGVYGNLVIDGFIIDNNNKKKNFGQNGMIFNFNRHPNEFSKLSNITVQNCETRNAPRGSTADPFIIGVDINVYISDNAQRLTNCLIENITVQDCIFGKIGYGGSYGVRYQAILGNGGALGGLTDGDFYRTPQWLSNIVFNNTVLKRLYHNGGPSSQTYYTNSNYMLGSVAHGDKLICEDLVGDVTGDDGLEINSYMDVDVNRCQFMNADNGDALFLNNGGGMPYPEQQHIRVRNCTFGPTAYNNGTSSIIVRYKPNCPHGTIIIENTKFYDGAALLVRGAYQQLVLRDLSFYRSKGVTNGGLVNDEFIQIDQYSQKSQITMENITGTYAYTYQNPNNTNNSYLNVALVRFITAIDAVISVKNMQLINKIDVQTTLYGGGIQLRTLKFPTILPADEADYAAAGNGNFYFDTGNVADQTVAAGQATPSNTANLNAEQRTIGMGSSNSYYASNSGPQTDICSEIEMGPGSTIGGWKGGVVGKSPAATTYTEGYVFDDGVASYLCLDKIVAGTRTSLLGTSTNAGAGTITDIGTPLSYTSGKGILLASRITANTSFWVRYKQQGTAVQANYHTASMAYGTTVTSTASATFGAGSSNQLDLALFVESQAPCGYSWVPKSIDSTIKTWRVGRMNVISGTVENVSYAHLTGQPIITAVAVSNGMTTLFNRIVNGPLRIVNCGVSRHMGLATATQDIDTLNDMGAFFKRIGARFKRSGVVTTLTAPGSTTPFTNDKGFDIVVDWYGGILTVVEVSVDEGTTWSQIRGAGDGNAFLMPGDLIRWTYSSAPTFKYRAAS